MLGAQNAIPEITAVRTKDSVAVMGRVDSLADGHTLTSGGWRSMPDSPFEFLVAAVDYRIASATRVSSADLRALRALKTDWHIALATT